MRNREGRTFTQLDELLKDIINELNDDHDDRPQVSRDEQLQEIKMFAARSQKLNVGDCVVRTGFGRKMYKMPCEHQVAVVTQIFSQPVFRDDKVVTGEIAVALEPGVVVAFPVDLRYYKAERA